METKQKTEEKSKADFEINYDRHLKELFEILNRREWLSTEEAAEYLRISADALRIRVHRGHIIPHRIGRRLRFKVAELDALMKPVGV